MQAFQEKTESLERKAHRDILATADLLVRQVPSDHAESQVIQAPSNLLDHLVLQVPQDLPVLQGKRESRELQAF